MYLSTLFMAGWTSYVGLANCGEGSTKLVSGVRHHENNV
jgi:hypothetical protein